MVNIYFTKAKQHNTTETNSKTVVKKTKKYVPTEFSAAGQQCLRPQHGFGKREYRVHYCIYRNISLRKERRNGLFEWNGL